MFNGVSYAFTLHAIIALLHNAMFIYFHYCLCCYFAKACTAEDNVKDVIQSVIFSEFFELNYFRNTYEILSSDRLLDLLFSNVCSLLVNDCALILNKYDPSLTLL